jgi:hypothetical protein
MVLSYESLKEIVNKLGIFYEDDISFEMSRIILITGILVGLNLNEGLVVEMVLHMGNVSITQAMDYIGVPFKCV